MNKKFAILSLSVLISATYVSECRAERIPQGKFHVGYGARLGVRSEGEFTVIDCDVSKRAICYVYDGEEVHLTPAEPTSGNPFQDIRTDYIPAPVAGTSIDTTK
jgi:hypothetical protein